MQSIQSSQGHAACGRVLLSERQVTTRACSHMHKNGHWMPARLLNRNYNTDAAPGEFREAGWTPALPQVLACLFVLPRSRHSRRCGRRGSAKHSRTDTKRVRCTKHELWQGCAVLGAVLRERKGSAASVAMVRIAAAAADRCSPLHVAMSSLITYTTANLQVPYHERRTTSRLALADGRAGVEAPAAARLFLSGYCRPMMSHVCICRPAAAAVAASLAMPDVSTTPTPTCATNQCFFVTVVCLARAKCCVRCNSRCAKAHACTPAVPAQLIHRSAGQVFEIMLWAPHRREGRGLANAHDCPLTNNALDASL